MCGVGTARQGRPPRQPPSHHPGWRGSSWRNAGCAWGRPRGRSSRALTRGGSRGEGWPMPGRSCRRRAGSPRKAWYVYATSQIWSAQVKTAPAAVRTIRLPSGGRQAYARAPGPQGTNRRRNEPGTSARDLWPRAGRGELGERGGWMWRITLMGCLVAVGCWHAPTMSVEPGAQRTHAQNRPGPAC
jgi:hypothetical protein